MFSLIATLMTLAFVAIPIFVVVKIARRLQQVTRGVSDPARLRRVFAEHAVDALRRAGADPKTVAKLEVLRQEPVTERAAELHAKAYEARIGLERKGGYAVPNRLPAPAAPEPTRLFEDEPRPQPLRHPPRLRARPTQAPIGGLDMGDSFRLSQPPDQGEPHAPFAVSNWVALALLAGAAAWWFLR